MAGTLPVDDLVNSSMSIRYYRSGTIDPSIIPLDAPAGSFYLKTSAPIATYQKQDNGLTSNWNLLPSSTATFASEFNRYVDPNGDDTTGNGSFEKPFRNISAALASFAPGDQGTIILGSGQYPEAGPIAWKNNVNMIGSVASTTNVNAHFTYTSSAGETTIFTFANLAMQNFIDLDLTLSDFYSISMVQGLFGIKRADSNLSGILGLTGAISDGSILNGKMELQGVLIGGTIVIGSGAQIASFSTNIFAGNFDLQGTAIFTTVDTLFAPGSYIHGTVIGPDTPVWRTDTQSDFGFTGSLTKVFVDSATHNNYTPTTPANWTGSPTTVQAALDRIAAAVVAGIPGPIA